jgi:hypothetical protein
VEWIIAPLLARLAVFSGADRGNGKYMFLDNSPAVSPVTVAIALLTVR